MISNILYFICGVILSFALIVILFLKGRYDESTGTSKWKEFLREEKRKKKLGGKK